MYEQFRPRMAKSIIDEIEYILAKHYGFTDEELDFIINYDIKCSIRRAWYKLSFDVELSTSR